MDHTICLNNLSLPAANRDEAYALFSNAVQGVLWLNSGEDRFFLYCDGEELSECQLATDFTISDYKACLLEQGEVDLFYFFSEVEDKSPLIENVVDEDFQELVKFTVYFDNRAYDTADIFGYAYLKQGMMLSLPTEQLWTDYTIEFNLLVDGDTVPRRCKVYNISSVESVELIRRDDEVALVDLIEDVNFSTTFLQWYNEQLPEDKGKVRQVLCHCHDNKFALVRPVIDTLRDSKYPNMKEVRVGNAHATSGKIRILFAQDTQRVINVLVGFIKHSNDYSEPIREADGLFEAVLASYE